MTNKGNERLPYSAAMRLRLLLCMIFFILFTIMNGRMETSVSQFIYRRLEEPMSEETVQTWIRGVKKSISMDRNIDYGVSEQ